jgi:hypothetical protein
MLRLGSGAAIQAPAIAEVRSIATICYNLLGDQREVVAHVRFCSDCRHDDAQQRNDAMCQQQTIDAEHFPWIGSGNLHTLLRGRDASNLIVQVQKQSHLLFCSVEADEPIPIGFTDGQLAASDFANDVFSGNHHEVSGLRSGHVDLRSHIAAFGYEARPQHRLDQQERECRPR